MHVSERENHCAATSTVPLSTISSKNILPLRALGLNDKTRHPKDDPWLNCAKLLFQIGACGSRHTYKGEPSPVRIVRLCRLIMGHLLLFYCLSVLALSKGKTRTPAYFKQRLQCACLIELKKILLSLCDYFYVSVLSFIPGGAGTQTALSVAYPSAGSVSKRLLLSSEIEPLWAIGLCSRSLHPVQS